MKNGNIIIERITVVSADNQVGNFEIMVDVAEVYRTAITEEALIAAARAALIAEGLGGKAIGVSVEIAGDDEVQRLNREYRGVDRTTDVLSFANEEAPDWEGRPGVVYNLADSADGTPLEGEDSEDWDEEYEDEANEGPDNQGEVTAPRFVTAPELQAQHQQRYLGDIIISYPQAERQAAEFNNTPGRETQELVIHGVFHLLGYDHEDPDDRELMRAKEAAAAALLDH
jgi:probable rRNA maturation factor